MVVVKILYILLLVKVILLTHNKLLRKYLQLYQYQQEDNLTHLLCVEDVEPKGCRSWRSDDRSSH